MVTREQLLEYIANKNLVYDDVYPKDDCIYKRKYEQLVKEIKETEIWREQTMNNLQIKLLSENATMPTRANATDAGYDIYAAEAKILEPQEKAIIKTDVAVNIPKGHVGLLTSRSGVSSKTNLVIETGKIDSGFHGNIGINIKNDEQHYRTVNVQYFDLQGEMTDQFINDSNDKPYVFNNRYHINKGAKLAQLVIVPIWNSELEEVDEFDTESTRGTNGFGSTGY